ncbi:MAG: aminoacyl-tRNA hydrolase [Alphaproteobacteria bacterium]|nr:aminoacyl-tRNA hydrolase [Alphaproteobacteria bacterium]
MHFVIAGLGNPGAQYQFHRHNIGFLIIQALLAKYDITPKAKHNALIADIKINNSKVTLIMPQNYMNRSGAPIAKLLNFYQIPPENLLVIHDELDLPSGAVKLKFSGGTAGHNGLKDIGNHIGKDYWRLRIGINHPGHPAQVSDYVLSNFNKAEMTDIFIPLIADIRDNIDLLLGDDNFSTDNNRAFLEKISQ